MNVDEILAKDDPTDEELKFLEQELLKTAYQLKDAIGELTGDLEKKDPAMAAHLKKKVDSMVGHIEQAAAIPWD